MLFNIGINSNIDTHNEWHKLLVNKNSKKDTTDQ